LCVCVQLCVWCVCVCVCAIVRHVETSTVRRSGPDLGCCATKK